MRVDFDRPLRSWSHAFTPVVLVGEAAARPADHRDLQVSESLHNVVAVSPRVRNLGVFADPDAAVDSGAQVLGELAEQLAVDLRSGAVGVDREARGRSLLRQSGQRRGGESENDSRGHDSGIKSTAMRRRTIKVLIETAAGSTNSCAYASRSAVA